MTWFLLDRRTGWRTDRVLTTHCAVGDDIGLAAIPGFPQPLTDASGTFGGLTDPTGVATGPGGDVVMLDADGRRVLRFDPCDAAFHELDCLPGRGAQFSDVAIDDHGDLLLAERAARRVVVLSADGRYLRQVIAPRQVTATGIVVARPTWTIPLSGGPAEPRWPAGTWDPVALTTGRGRRFVADEANGLIHVFDDSGVACLVTDGSGNGLSGLVRPRAIAVDTQGTMYVLQTGATTVRVIGPDGVGVAEVTTLDDRRQRFCPVAVAVSPSGELCVATPGGCLAVVDQGTGCTRRAEVGRRAVVRGLAFDRHGDAVVTDAGNSCLVRLIGGGGYERAGRFVTTPLDAGVSECRWHRVALEADVPAATAVRIATLTADVALDTAELPPPDDERWVTSVALSGAHCGPWDVLVRSQPGRYLWVAVELSGDGRATPRIGRVECHAPRHSSITLLPAAFQAEPSSSDFLDRFLSIFDTVRATVTSTVDRTPQLLDPAAAPAGGCGEPDFLTWLAGWVGIADQERLPVERRRRLVASAAALYRRRGTPDGVGRHVALFCGARVRVLEHYRLRRWAIAGHGRLGDTSQLFGAEIVRRLQLDRFSRLDEARLDGTDDPRHDPFLVHAHRFTLFVDAAPSADPERVAERAERILALAKPAHTAGDIAVVQPRMRVGIQAMVGLDSVVADTPLPSTTGTVRLRHGSVVTGRTAAGAGALTTSARLGSTSTLT